MMGRKIALAATLLALSGCFGSAPPVPQERYYRLSPEPTSQQIGPLLGSRVAVAPFEADGLLQDRALLFADAGPAGALVQRDYHFWVDTPPRLIRDELVGFLRDSRPGVEVVTPDLRVPASLEIVGKLRRFEERPGAVTLELELGLIEVANDRLIFIADYRVERPLDAESGAVDEAVTAFNAAVAEVFGRFLDDTERTLAAEGLAQAPVQ